MPEKEPKHPFRFWQELKRRNVVRVLVMYAGTAFIILEVVNNVVEPLHLPEWTATLVILLLITGFPIVAVLSWIFDVTPEGLKKTEVLEEEEPVNQHAERRRIRISNLVIAALVVVIGILVYPRIFHKDKFKEVRDADGKLTIAILPFENLTGNPELDFWQRGISELVINDLGSSDQLAVLSSQAVSEVMAGMHQVQEASMLPSIAREAALKLEAGVHITGSYQKTSQRISMLVNLIDTENGEVMWSHRIDGDAGSDFIDLADSLAYSVRNYLEIKEIERDVQLEFRNAFTASAGAYKKYIEGLDLGLRGEYQLAIEAFTEAYTMDTTFVFAAWNIAGYYTSLKAWMKVREWTRKALRGKERLPLKYQYILEVWRAGYITKDGDDIRKYLDLLNMQDFQSRLDLMGIGGFYYNIHEYEKALPYFERVEELNLQWEDPWSYPGYYDGYGQVCHELGMHRKEQELYATGITYAPKDSLIHLHRCICAASQHDTLHLAQYMEDFFSALTRVQPWEAYQERLKGVIYAMAGLPEETVEHYRKATELDPVNDWFRYLYAARLIDYDMDADKGMEIIEELKIKYPEAEESNADLWLKEGKYMMLKGDYEGALKKFKAAKEAWLTYLYDIDELIRMAEEGLAGRDQS